MRSSSHDHRLNLSVSESYASVHLGLIDFWTFSDPCYFQSNIRDPWWDFGDYSGPEYWFCHRFLGIYPYARGALEVYSHLDIFDSWRMFLTFDGILHVVDFCIWFMLLILCTCVVGSWQWPWRGIRVGEASHPGPPWMTRAEASLSERLNVEPDDATQMPDGGVPIPRPPLTAAEKIEEDLFGDADDEEVIENVGLVCTHFDLVVNDDDDDATQDTVGGGTPNVTFRFGPEVEVLSL